MITLSQKEIVDREKLKLHEMTWDEEHKDYIPKRFPSHKGRINDNTLLMCNGLVWDAQMNDFFPYFCIKSGGKYHLLDIEYLKWNLFHELVLKTDGDYLEAAKLFESYNKL